MQRIQNSAVRLFGSLPCSYHMQNPVPGFFSMVSCLSSSNAHVLAAQDITDLFNVKQRAGVYIYYQASKIGAKPRVFFKHDNTRLEVF